MGLVFNQKEQLFARLVPLEDHITDNVVMTTRKGAYAMFDVAGVSTGTADEADITHWFDQLHNAMMNIAADDIEVMIYQCRGEADPSLCQPGQHSTELAQSLANEYVENLYANGLYWNRTFISIEVIPQSAAGKSARELVLGAGSSLVGIDALAERCDGVCALLQSQLSAFGLRRLGYEERGRGLYDQIPEALAFALTGVSRQVPATTGRMGNTLLSETLRFKRSHVEFLGAGVPSYAAMFAMKEYPVKTWPGCLFDALAVAPYNNTLIQSFRFLNTTDAIGALGRKQNRMVMAGDKGISQAEALTHAADELMNHQWVLGDHSLVLLAFADSVKALNVVGNAAWRDLASSGVVAMRLHKAIQAAFLSAFSSRYRPRPGFIKSSNLVAMAPLWAFPSGERQGYWGDPICVFRTLAGTPYFFHWHVLDVGSTLITGVVGAGKTLLTAFLIAMTGSRARIVALDHKQGWRFLAEQLGGDYAVLGNGEPHFAPLKALDPTPANIDFLTDLIRGCIAGEMTEEETRRLSVALDVVMSMPRHMRSMGEIRAFFDDGAEGAGARLEKWCFGNALGWVVDGPKDTLSFSGLDFVDVTALLANPRARGPAQLYLYHRIAMLLDGTPLLIPIDEGWRALVDPIFSTMIETSIRTIRSKGGVMVFITQSPGDIVEAGISRVLLEMCPTRFHLANPRGKQRDYCQGFDLTEGEFHAHHVLQPGQGWFLLQQGANSVVAQLPMQGMDEHIRLLSAREKDLKEAARERIIEGALA